MNSYTIEFSEFYEYDTLETGTTLPVLLKNGSLEVDIQAKLDTGSSHCIFERRFGENIGIEIENGRPEKFGTVTSGFVAYGHELNISVLGIEIYTLERRKKLNHFDKKF